MRKLVLVLWAGFAALLAATMHIAVGTYEGPVEEGYYRKSLSFFAQVRAAGDAAPPEAAVPPESGGKVLLRIEPVPVRAMRELSFTVDLPGEPPRGTPRIDLAMPGMAMPPNRVDLSPCGAGRWCGKGMVVRCPAGGKSWTATLRVPGRADSVFPFDVAD